MTAILIVDDHPLYREGLAATLRRRDPPIHVLSADSAAAGAEILRAERAIELVIVDVHLPDVDGYAAVAAYARQFPTVCRALISGDETPAQIRLARASGASGFFPKSLPVDAMLAAILGLLAGAPWFPEPLAVRARGTGNGSLSLRQLEVLTLAATGASNKEIAQRLGIAERTVKSHLESVFENLGARNRTQAVLRAVAQGLVKGPASQ